MRLSAYLMVATLLLAPRLPGQIGNQQAKGRIDIDAEKAAIRAAADAKIDSSIYAPDAVFWSGAYAKPIVHDNGRYTAVPIDSAHMSLRRNYKRTEEIVRLDVAKSGDLAYDFTNFTMSFDVAGTNEHVSVKGSALRVWKKIDGRWRIEAWFMRPYDSQDAKSTASPSP